MIGLNRKKFMRAAATYEQAALLHREVGQRLLERLDGLHVQPQAILDLGANTGIFTKLLAKRFKQAKNVIALDIAETMLIYAKRRAGWWSREKFVAADADSLPLADASVDLIYSALVLPWCSDLPRVFAEIKRVLRPGGLFLFATYGPDTLCELRQAWQQVDSFQHTLTYTDMHDVGDALLQAGLIDAVLDVEQLTVMYGSVMQLIREIKATGANYFGPGRRPGLTSKQAWQAFLQAYSAGFQQEQGLPATYEIVYGHAFAPMPRVQQTNSNEVVIPISAVKRHSDPSVS